MDPSLTPIQGISLERFAELGAEVADTVNDQEACARIVESNGVPRSDWDIASKGWMARMQDPALMGRVAMAYMPLYQAALAKKKGTVDVSFEDYVALSGARAALGAPRFAAQYGLDDTSWTLIAGSWNARIPTDPRYMMFGMQVEQEANRIRQGGPPKAVSVTRSGAGGTATQTSGGGGVVAPVPIQAPRTAQELENEMMAQAVREQVAQVQANANAQAAAAYGNAASDMGFMGRGVLGAVGMGAIASGIGPGMAILVAWSDGKRYPGQCMQVANAQVLVAFGDGRQIWVPETSVARQGSSA
jgi:hypothetical protein